MASQLVPAAAKRRRQSIPDPNSRPESEVPDALRCRRRFGGVQIANRVLGTSNICHWRCPYPRLPNLSLCEKHHKYIIDRRKRKVEAAAAAAHQLLPDPDAATASASAASSRNSKRDSHLQLARVGAGNGRPAAPEYDSGSHSEATESESEGPADHSRAVPIPAAVKEALIDRQRQKRPKLQRLQSEEPAPEPSELRIKQSARLAAAARVRHKAAGGKRQGRCELEGGSGTGGGLQVRKQQQQQLRRKEEEEVFGSCSRWQEIVVVPKPRLKPAMVRCLVSPGVYLRSITGRRESGTSPTAAGRFFVALMDGEEQQLWKQGVEGRVVAVGGDTDYLFWAVTLESSPEKGSALQAWTWRAWEGGQDAPRRERGRRLPLDSRFKVADRTRWKFVCVTRKGTLHMLDFSEGGLSMVDVPVQMLIYSRFFGRAYGDYSDMEWRLTVKKAWVGSGVRDAIGVELRLGEEFCYHFRLGAWMVAGTSLARKGKELLLL